MYSLEERLEKLKSGVFTTSDLSSFVQKRVKPASQVKKLLPHKWLKAGKYWLLNKQVIADLDDLNVRIVVRENVPYFNWLRLPLAYWFDKGNWVMWGNIIPKTNVILDVWFVGNGTEGIILVAETDSQNTFGVFKELKPEELKDKAQFLALKWIEENRPKYVNELNKAIIGSIKDRKSDEIFMVSVSFRSSMGYVYIRLWVNPISGEIRLISEKP